MPKRFYYLAICAVLGVVLSSSSRAGSYPAGNGTLTFDFADGTIDLKDGSAIGSDQKTAAGDPVGGIYAGMMRLADKNTTNSVGSFKAPDLDPGNVIKSFDVRFNVVMDKPAADAPGEGWSVSFGHLPSDNGAGEGGFAPFPRGLTMAFDAYNNGDDLPSIEIYIGGISVTNVPVTYSFDAGARSAVIHWDSAGLDITYANKVICTDLQTPGFSPGPGDQFGFSGRTTTNTMDVLVDNLKIGTTALPIIETGGPIISEFVANNGDFEDEFAEKPGWLEILNGSGTSLDLTGWYLTDSKANLKKWQIKGLTITPYNYQVVFASGRDRQLSSSSFLHTSFSLAKSGGYLALVKPDGTNIVSSFEYGQQEKSVGYGEMGVNRQKGYMYPATPGTVNTVEPAPSSLAPAVQFSHPGGFVLEPVTFTLSVSNAPGAEIHYTMDRTEPTLKSPLYTNSLSITGVTTMVRARAYWTNHLPSVVTSLGFIFPDASLTNYSTTGKVFESNLPIIFIDSFGFAVDSYKTGTKPFRPSYAVVIPPDPATGRATLLSKPEYAGPSGTHVRGESSSGFGQVSYALELWDEAQKDEDHPLLGMPEDSDWVLYGPWSEKTFMRNKLIFDWMIKMRGQDGMAMRTRFVEVFFNQSKPASGKVGYSSYRGVYVLMEKLKRGKDRLPIENLNDKTIDPDLITGGYIVRHDKDDTLKNNWTTPRFGVTMQSYDPDKFNTNQLNYIRNYLSNFETTLNSTGFRNVSTGYLAYIDPEYWIDSQWMIEITKQVDGYVFSCYFHKDRAGRFRSGPLWDFNIALGNADYANATAATNWLYETTPGPTTSLGVGQLWYPRFHADPDYKVAHWDRYWQMRHSILESNTVNAQITGYMTNLLDGYSGFVSNNAPAAIQNPVARHYRKYQRLGIYDWPNPPAVTTLKSYQSEVEYLRKWVHSRLVWIDDQTMRSGKNIYRPPLFSNEGGKIDGPLDVTIRPYARVEPSLTFPTGDIYYTLDNSDPRLPGGNISPAAQKYSGPIHVESSVTINARLYSMAPVQKQWSALATETYLLNTVPASSSNVVVSELMFNPAALNPAETNALIVDSQHFEYIELRNISNQSVDLNGVHFTKGVDFDFTYTPPVARLLKPGESVLVVQDKRAFQLRNPLVPGARIVGVFRGHLDSGGETIEVAAADGSVIQKFQYDNKDPWPAAADGRSIVLKDAVTNPNPDTASHWSASARIGGTPGVSGLGGDIFTGDPLKDSDSDGLPDLFEFASGSDAENPGSGMMPAGGLVFDASQGNYFTFAYQRQPSAQGVKFTIESSQDLRNWAADTTTLVLNLSVTNHDGTITETYKGNAPIPQQQVRTFYRLKLQKQ